MFTGLVEEVGALVARTPRGKGARVRIETRLGPLVLGESIAVSGVCLTVDTVTAGGFEADASVETLAKTTLGGVPLGAPVNLERALAVGSRLGGHIVTGHVDGKGALRERRPADGAEHLTFEYPRELARFIATKGSITIDGVSLTVNHVTDSTFDVMLIPHTLSKTTLRHLAAGHGVNLEVDVLARYAARLQDVTRAGDASAPLHSAHSPASSDAAWLERLNANGYV